MKKKLQDENIDFLFKAVLKLETLEECYDFFEDVCTVQEIKSIAQRLKVAKLLTEKRVYNYIVEKTGASTATISRVNRTLNYGNDGYRLIIERLNADLAE